MPSGRCKTAARGEQASGCELPVTLGFADVKRGLAIGAHAAHRGHAEIQVRVEVFLYSLARVFDILVCGAGAGSEVHMEIDQPRNQKFSSAVDLFHARRNRHVGAVAYGANARAGDNDHRIRKRRTAATVDEHRSDDGFLQGFFRWLAPSQIQCRYRGKADFQ